MFIDEVVGFILEVEIELVFKEGFNEVIDIENTYGCYRLNGEEGA